jgi:transposase
MGQVDPDRLVFLDESGLDTRLTRSHARAPQGQRAVGRIPGGHWRRLTSLGHRHLPAYSPDLNPIELAWPKLKARLRAVAPRTIDTIEDALADALDAITPDDARAWFQHCGYRSS